LRGDKVSQRAELRGGQQAEVALRIQSRFSQ
jgi:hypothetical protein